MHFWRRRPRGVDNCVQIGSKKPQNAPHIITQRGYQEKVDKLPVTVTHVVRKNRASIAAMYT